MSSGGGGAGRGGYSGGGFVGGDGEEAQDEGSGAGGLNPNRVLGFRSAGPRRFETPSLNDMKVKQAAIFAKFLTFSKGNVHL